MKAERTFDVGPGYVRARECPDCLHTRCGEGCNCNCDAARAEHELAWCRGRLEELEAVLARAEDPEQAARERLGRWLTSALGRSFERQEHCDSLEWQRRIVLFEFGQETVYGPWLRTPDSSGCPDDALADHEAINAALDRAEGKEPT